MFYHFYFVLQAILLVFPFFYLLAISVRETFYDSLELKSFLL